MDTIQLATTSQDPLQSVGMMFYFSPESTSAGEPIGLDMVALYAGGRGGVLGDLSPREVDEIFYFFNPGMVSGMVENARSIASIDDAVIAHIAAAKAYANRKLGNIDESTLNEFSDAVEVLVATLPNGNWPIFDGYCGLPRPSSPIERAYHWAIVMRELRGGVHTDVVKEYNLSALAACQLDRGGTFYALHGYSEEQRVEETPEIIALKNSVEDETNHRMAELFESLNEDQRNSLAAGAIAMETAVTSKQ